MAGAAPFQVYAPTLGFDPEPGAFGRRAALLSASVRSELEKGTRLEGGSFYAADTPTLVLFQDAVMGNTDLFLEPVMTMNMGKIGKVLQTLKRPILFVSFGLPGGDTRQKRHFDEHDWQAYRTRHSLRDDATFVEIFPGAENAAANQAILEWIAAAPPPKAPKRVSFAEIAAALIAHRGDEVAAAAELMASENTRRRALSSPRTHSTRDPRRRGKEVYDSDEAEGPDDDNDADFAPDSPPAPPSGRRVLPARRTVQERGLKENSGTVTIDGKKIPLVFRQTKDRAKLLKRAEEMGRRNQKFRDHMRGEREAYEMNPGLKLQPRAKAIDDDRFTYSFFSLGFSESPKALVAAVDFDPNKAEKAATLSTIRALIEDMIKNKNWAITKAPGFPSPDFEVRQRAGRADEVVPTAVQSRPSVQPTPKGWQQRSASDD